MPYQRLDDSRVLVTYRGQVYQFGKNRYLSILARIAEGKPVDQVMADILPLGPVRADFTDLNAADAQVILTRRK